ncbi:MAG TPA: GTPase Era [Ignavibacteria bacterium]|nr:GTPase Era [Ignavibacteria bacterium]
MQKKSGFVTIIGAPNAGKSTLLNALIGENLSIVTSKPQTTRNRIFGILTEGNIQAVFVDTPGILEPKYRLQQYMASEIDDSFEEADLILVIYDTQKDSRGQLKKIVSKYGKSIGEKKSILVLNKIDSIKKEDLLKMLSEVQLLFNFTEIIPVSAKKKFNVVELKKVILNLIPEGEFFYGEDVITSQPEKFFVSEIIRKNLFRMMKEEVPFSVYVMINEFKERDTGKDYINASVIVERESQKSIIIGADGNRIKELGERSRKTIEGFLNREVYLELFVKVSKNWKNDEEFLRKNVKQISKPLA